MASLSCLVAWRDTGDGRDRSWNLIRDKLALELPEAEVCVGSDDAVPFNKSRALNQAAEQATGDVFLITDADTWVLPDLVREATGNVRRHWVKPWNRKLRLDEEATRTVLELGMAWDGAAPAGAKYENVNNYWAAPPIVLSRQAWDDVGGMDERFDKGWGSEDAALAFALRTFYGRSVVLRGAAVHLFHPRIGRSGRDLWTGQEASDAHRDLFMDYNRASRSPAQMRELIASRGGRIDTVPSLRP